MDFIYEIIMITLMFPIPVFLNLISLDKIKSVPYGNEKQRNYLKLFGLTLALHLALLIINTFLLLQNFYNGNVFALIFPFFVLLISGYILIMSFYAIFIYISY